MGLFEDVFDLLHMVSRKFRKYIKSNHRRMLENACVSVERIKMPVVSPNANLNQYKSFNCYIKGARSGEMKMSEIRIAIDPIISMTSLQIVMSLEEEGEEEIEERVSKRIGGPKIGQYKTL